MGVRNSFAARSVALPTLRTSGTSSLEYPRLCSISVTVRWSRGRWQRLYWWPVSGILFSSRKKLNHSELRKSNTKCFTNYLLNCLKFSPALSTTVICSPSDIPNKVYLNPRGIRWSLPSSKASSFAWLVNVLSGNMYVRKSGSWKDDNDGLHLLINSPAAISDEDSNLPSSHWISVVKSTVKFQEVVWIVIGVIVFGMDFEMLTGKRSPVGAAGDRSHSGKML